MQPALPLTLAAVPFPVIVLALAFVITCLFLMLVVLVQKPKGGGLSGAFGGAGGGEGALMGAKVGDFLTYTTVGLFVLFILLAMGLTWTISPEPAPITQNIAQTSGGLGGEDLGDTESEALVVPEDEAAAADAPETETADPASDAGEAATTEDAPETDATP